MLIYIYIERERSISIHVYTYICMYVHIYIYIYIYICPFSSLRRQDLFPVHPRRLPQRRGRPAGLGKGHRQRKQRHI